MNGKLMNRIFRFYSKVYFTLLIVTPVYALICIGGLYFFTNIEPAELHRDFNDGANLALASVSFFIWWKIFSNLKTLDFSLAINSNSLLMAKLSKLFFFSFCLDLIRVVFKNLFFYNSPVDWTTVTLPNSNLNSTEYIFRLFLWTFKVFAKFEDFLTPSTYGLTSLVIAGLLYILAERQMKTEI